VTEPNQVDFIIDPYIAQSAEEIDSFWNKLNKNLNSEHVDSRIVPIIWDVGFQKYVDGILAAKLTTDAAHNYLRYNEKIDVLKKMGYLDDKLCRDLLKMYEIRNICAHVLNIDEGKIFHLLNSLESLHGIEVIPYENYAELFSTLSTGLTSQLSKIFDECVADSVDVVS